MEHVIWYLVWAAAAASGCGGGQTHVEEPAPIWDDSTPDAASPDRHQWPSVAPPEPRAEKPVLFDPELLDWMGESFDEVTRRCRAMGGVGAYDINGALCLLDKERWSAANIGRGRLDPYGRQLVGVFPVGIASSVGRVFRCSTPKSVADRYGGYTESLGRQLDGSMNRFFEWDFPKEGWRIHVTLTSTEDGCYVYQDWSTEPGSLGLQDGLIVQ